MQQLFVVRVQCSMVLPKSLSWHFLTWLQDSGANSLIKPHLHIGTLHIHWLPTLIGNIDFSSSGIDIEFHAISRSLLDMRMISDKTLPARNILNFRMLKLIPRGMAPTAPAPMLPGILILNAKYLPDSETSAAKVGATSFAFSVAHVLQDAGLFAGMILYQRREDLSHPHILLKTQTSFSCAVLYFNFGMRRSDIRGAIGSATEMLLVANRRAAGPAILYHQTDTLLAYSPEGLPSCVTQIGRAHV